MKEAPGENMMPSFPAPAVPEPQTPQSQAFLQVPPGPPSPRQTRKLKTTALSTFSRAVTQSSSANRGPLHTRHEAKFHLQIQNYTFKRLLQQMQSNCSSIFVETDMQILHFTWKHKGPKPPTPLRQHRGQRLGGAAREHSGMRRRASAESGARAE